MIDSQDVTVCYCSGIGRRQIIAAIKDGAKTLQQIRDATGACTVGNCIRMNPQKRCCSRDIIKMIEEYAL
jgi:bacterioferritin-associated ferredoxin